MESVVPVIRFMWGEVLESALSSFIRGGLETPMTTKAHVVHHIPGRVRLRVPSRRRQPAFFHDVKKRLEGLDSVSSVSVNPTSGSVLIRYQGQIEQVLAQAATVGLVELLEVTTDLPFLEPIAEQLISRLGDIDQTISKRTQGALDGRSALLAGFLVAAIVQAFRGSLLGPAIPLLWYATQAMGSSLPSRPQQAPGLESSG